MEEIAKAAESGEVVEGDVTECNKGGVVVNVKGVKVFVPRSQATMRDVYKRQGSSCCSTSCPCWFGICEAMETTYDRFI